MTEAVRKDHMALLDGLFDELFPILRSITGPGLIQSLEIFSRYMPLKIEGISSGEKVFDWTVPEEWHLKTARLIGPAGETVLDARDNNLHVLNYSESVDHELSLEELQNHLYSLPDNPAAVPYVTSYYNRRWGFCLSDAQRCALKPGNYRAHIESRFESGKVPFATCVLEGESDHEVVLSSYLCHPSMANNELSGPLTLLSLFLRLSAWPRRRFTYRFVLNPETIGALCFLSRYGDQLKDKMVGGLVLTCLGGPKKKLSYKTSRQESSLFDRLADRWARSGLVESRPFTPTHGSDERQYCSPGFNLPMGQMARTIYGDYDGYHNSMDTKEFMTIAALVDSAEEIELFLKRAEIAGPFVNLAPYGEPQLGKRGLYPTENSASTWARSSDDTADHRIVLNRLLMVLNYSDGKESMLQIADRCGCRLIDLEPIVDRLEKEGLLALKAVKGHESSISVR